MHFNERLIMNNQILILKNAQKYFNILKVHECSCRMYSRMPKEQTVKYAGQKNQHFTF